MGFGPFLLLALLEGTVAAAVLALTAVGLSLVFGVMRVVNVAHGEFFMLGAMLAWWVAQMVPGGPAVGFLAALIVALNAAPYPLHELWGKVWYTLAWSALGLLLTIAVALSVAYPNLPDVSDLSTYRPKLPLRVYSSEGVLMGEFGEERRSLTPIKDIPQVMKDAVLSIEDARFYQHGGLDYLGLIRAGIANLGKRKSQGASTITMQVARNVYLSTEKTYTRKIYEILLTFKLEHLLTKDQILEIYMNQIFLGNRAYGFASAAETYFGKPLKDISIAEAAMLAGLPKAPSAYNPIVNPKRAAERQHYVIERMLDNLDHRYRRTLDWVLAHPKTTVGMSFGSVVLAGILAVSLPGEFMPKQDRGEVLGDKRRSRPHTHPA